MVRGAKELLTAVRKAYASLFTARAISYREDMGFNHMDVALSVGVQRMVRSDLACSGVIFTLDTESGFRDLVMINSTWGFGENLVQGKVTPDEFYVFKPTLAEGYRPIIRKIVGAKEQTLRFDEFEHHLVDKPTSRELRDQITLTDDEVLALAHSAITIEAHYSEIHGRDVAMDIEWAKDGITGELFIVQARPETVHSKSTGSELRTFALLGERTPILAQGLAVGNQIAVGKAAVITDPTHMSEFEDGDVLVTANTDPDWEPIMKRAAGIVTEHGSRTSHAAIVSRELGVPAVVGTGDATAAVGHGDPVTVCCAEGDTGSVYAGALEYRVSEIDPTKLPRPRTKIMLNVGDPSRALSLGQLPVDGVGLARMEFIFASHVKVHPLALTRYDTLPAATRRRIDAVTTGYADKAEYFVATLARGIGTIAAAFHPRPIILRMSDFKTNEYASLIGGAAFEPAEDNPMIGWRGACRYYHPDYREGFELELKAVERVRNTFGLRNVKLMIPFCRTPAEGREVLEVMRQNGLERGKDDLEVYVMAELPSNIFEADEFAAIFDGFSIGSNDLTQLVLGVDRDSEKVASLFDERSDSVRRAIVMLLNAARKNEKPVGICGQAPSDYPEFAAFLVEHGIDSISLSSDALVETLHKIVEIEETKSAAFA
jgi:pyruvate,water dikinase